MRTVSFIFAFAVLFLGPSVAGSSDTNGLPGIGTFAFGSVIAPAQGQVLGPVLMAAMHND